jgi:hypothetical protein
MTVRHGDAQDVGRVQAKTAAGFVGAEGGACGAVEEQGGLEVGAGARPLDEAYAGAEVEALGGYGLAVGGEGFGRREETAETAAKICGASEVGFGGGVGTAQGEDAGGGGNGAKKFVGTLGEELGAMLERK